MTDQFTAALDDAEAAHTRYVEQLGLVEGRTSFTADGDRVRVAHVGLNERRPLWHPRPIAFRQIVSDTNGPAGVENRLGEMAPNETGTARDQDVAVSELHTP